MVRKSLLLAICLALFAGASATSFTVDSPPQQDPVVYVTKIGKKYHRNECRYLDHSKRAVNLACARQFVDPCKVCQPPQ